MNKILLNNKKFVKKKLNLIFEKYLDREIDESGFKTYHKLLLKGYTIEYIETLIKKSNEYNDKINIAKISDIYENIKEKVDDEGLNYYLNFYEKNKSFNQIENILKKSPEYKVNKKNFTEKLIIKEKRILHNLINYIQNYKLFVKNKNKIFYKNKIFFYGEYKK